MRYLMEVFANAGDVRVLQRTSRLNRLIEQRVGDAGAIVVRVVLCGDVSSCLVTKKASMGLKFGLVQLVCRVASGYICAKL